MHTAQGTESVPASLHLGVFEDAAEHQQTPLLQGEPPRIDAGQGCSDEDGQGAPAIGGALQAGSSPDSDSGLLHGVPGAALLIKARFRQSLLQVLATASSFHVSMGRFIHRYPQACDMLQLVVVSNR
jgi:hypothetical protein